MMPLLYFYIYIYIMCIYIYTYVCINIDIYIYIYRDSFGHKFANMTGWLLPVGGFLLMIAVVIP